MDLFSARPSFRRRLCALALGVLCASATGAAAQTAQGSWANQPVAPVTLTAGGQTYTDAYAQSFTTQAGPVCATTSGATVSSSACTSTQIASGDFTEASNQNFFNQRTPITQIPAAAVALGSEASVNLQLEYADPQSSTGVSYIDASVPLSDFATASSVSTQAATQAMLANALGGGASISAGGQLTAPSYAIQGASYSNVGSALNAEDTAVSTLSTNVATNETGVAAALGGGASVGANGQLTAPNYLIQGKSYLNVGSALTAEDTAVITLSNNVATNQSGVAAALGGGASVGANGQLTAPTYQVQGKSYSSVGSAITAEDAEVSSLATSVTALDAGMATLTGRVNAVQQFAYEARQEARQGIAGAMAMSQASMPSAPGRTSWVVNGATFRGETAFGGSLAHRFDTQVPLAVTGGFSVSGGEAGAKVGLAGEF